MQTNDGETWWPTASLRLWHPSAIQGSILQQVWMSSLGKQELRNVPIQYGDPPPHATAAEIGRKMP